MNLTNEQVAREREQFEAWFYGRGISSYATKMFAWDAWLYRASITQTTEVHHDSR